MVHTHYVLHYLFLILEHRKFSLDFFLHKTYCSFCQNMKKIHLRILIFHSFDVTGYDIPSWSISISFAVSHTTDDLVFIWDPQMPLDVDKGIELPQLELISTKNDDCTTEYSTGKKPKPINCHSGNGMAWRSSSRYVSKTINHLLTEWFQSTLCYAVENHLFQI